MVKQMLFLDPPALHPTKTERHQAYAVHHGARSWKDPQLLLARLRQVKAKERHWRARYQEAAKQSNQWRARCEQAEAELDALRRTTSP